MDNFYPKSKFWQFAYLQTEKFWPYKTQKPKQYPILTKKPKFRHLLPLKLNNFDLKILKNPNVIQFLQFVTSKLNNFDLKPQKPKYWPKITQNSDQKLTFSVQNNCPDNYCCSKRYSIKLVTIHQFIIYDYWCSETALKLL